MLPAYLEARIRRPQPQGCLVVPRSAPVVAFGNARTARVATVGLNPSRAEFPIEDGRLDGHGRRLASLDSLGVPSLEDAPAEKIETVLKECEAYFQRRPYRRWFDPLDEILQAIGATYYGDNPNACHLDLVQWATDPTWGKLHDRARSSLLEEDLPFLFEQLRESQIRLLLVNGQGVLSALQGVAGCELRRAGDPLTCGVVASRVLEGDLRGIRVLGWSVNLQSSHGVSEEFRRMLSTRIEELSSA